MDEVIINFLSQYGIIAIFIAIMLEYACFPISSEIVLPISGMIAVKIGTPLLFLILISVAAGIIGSSFCYLIGRCFKPVFEKYLARFPKIAKSFETTCNWQKRHGKFSVALARVIPIFRTYISFVSGIVKQKYIIFLGYSSIGILLWNSLLLSVGFVLGESSSEIIPLIQKFLIFIVAIFVIVIILKKIIKKRKRQGI